MGDEQRDGSSSDRYALLGTITAGFGDCAACPFLLLQGSVASASATAAATATALSLPSLCRRWLAAQ